jgi:hypothetical protein
MQKALKNVPDEQLRAHIIWLPMFPGDSRGWATTRSEEFTDKRLSYYWDGEKLTGKELQKVLGAKGVAWDIYLIYGAQSKWDKELPAPDFWMHQLRGETTAPTLDAAAFEAKLKEILNQTKR